MKKKNAKKNRSISTSSIFIHSERAKKANGNLFRLTWAIDIFVVLYYHYYYGDHFWRISRVSLAFFFSVVFLFFCFFLLLVVSRDDSIILHFFHVVNFKNGSYEFCKIFVFHFSHSFFLLTRHFQAYDFMDK